MRELQSIDAERGLQPAFRKSAALQRLVLIAAILLFHTWAVRLPNRVELGPRVATIFFDPIALDPGSFGLLRLAGAWKLTSDDPRFGGISGLAVDDNGLVALTDSGVIARFPKPVGSRATAQIFELPDGPGDSRYKIYRDSEALMRDPSGRGWWVAFENGNQLWLYDGAFRRAVRRMDFGRGRWPRNRGIEGVARKGSALLVIPEKGRAVMRVNGALAATLAIANARGWISDVALMQSGQTLVLERHPTPLGFSNTLALLETNGGNYRLGPPMKLGLSRLDNGEALAAERLPDGTTRLWLMTDDNFQRPMRTLLVALDWPQPRPQPAQQSSSRSRA